MKKVKFIRRVGYTIILGNKSTRVDIEPETVGNVLGEERGQLQVEVPGVVPNYILAYPGTEVQEVRA